MKKLFVLVLFSLITCSLSAQNNIRGKIKNYNDGKAEIILPIKDPMAIGQVSKKGKFTININNSTIEAINKSNEKLKAERGERAVRNKTVKETFYCDTEDVITINGDQVLESIAIMGNFFIGIIKDKKPIGKLRLVSSKAFGDSYFSFGKKDYVTGYYIDYYYTDKEASVNGVCKTKSYTLDMKDTFNLIHDYNVNLKKGWNILKTEITEVYTDQDGHIRPLKYKMSTINELPSSLKFIYTAGDKL